jgi:2,3-dihydroxy-2,3-dihydrophenylpropionate dehydrogenase
VSEIEIVRIPATGANAAALVKALGKARQGYLAPPACLGVDISSTPSEVVAIIRWASAQAHRHAATGPAAGEFFEAVQRLAESAPELQLFPLGEPSGRLCGEVAVVTGGASGIGRAVVERFVAEGALVAAVDCNRDGLASLEAAYGDRIRAIVADLTTVEGNRAAVQQAVAAFGRIDCYVANAGLFDGFFEFASLSLERLDAGYQSIFDINARGLILGCRAALPHLIASAGSIVVTLSNSALYPDGGGVLYVASKHAALGVVRQLAHELAPRVRVNAVAPGATRAPIGVPEVFGPAPDQSSPEISAAITLLVPLRRHAEPEDHASAYVLLASRSESRSMTGTVIESDGGLGARGLRRTRGGDDLAQRPFEPA